jgi:hypothetical protein
LLAGSPPAMTRPPCRRSAAGSSPAPSRSSCSGSDGPLASRQAAASAGHEVAAAGEDERGPGDVRQRNREGSPADGPAEGSVQLGNARLRAWRSADGRRGAEKAPGRLLWRGLTALDRLGSTPPQVREVEGGESACRPGSVTPGTLAWYDSRGPFLSCHFSCHWLTPPDAGCRCLTALRLRWPVRGWRRSPRAPDPRSRGTGDRRVHRLRDRRVAEPHLDHLRVEVRRG